MTNKLHVKKGDTVVVIAGKDKGVQGKILGADPKKGKVAVEKVAMVQKHQKPTQADPQGGIKKKEAFIDASNVMIYCDKCKKGVRIKKQQKADGGYERVCAKCDAKLD